MVWKPGERNILTKAVKCVSVAVDYCCLITKYKFISLLLKWSGPLCYPRLPHYLARIWVKYLGLRKATWPHWWHLQNCCLLLPLLLFYSQYLNRLFLTGTDLLGHASKNEWVIAFHWFMISFLDSSLFVESRIILRNRGRKMKGRKQQRLCEDSGDKWLRLLKLFW